MILAINILISIFLKEKLETMLEIFDINAYTCAKFCPMQLRGPIENGKYV